MSRPDYLYRHEPTSPQYVKFIYRVVGDTEKYWKCLLDGSGDTFLVRKSNLKEQGSDGRRYYPMTKVEVEEYRTRMRLAKKVSSLDPYKMSVVQLTDILKVAGEV